MTETYSYEEVYVAAKRGFGALYTIVRKDIRDKWTKMTGEERYNTMRALVRLSHIAQEPEKFLARRYTKAAWDARAHRYATEKNLAPQDVNFAYYIVANPVEIAKCHVINALEFSYNEGRATGGGHLNDFYHLADAFMNYDYCLTSEKLRGTSDNYARSTVGLSERLADRAAEIKANFAKRLMLQALHNFKEYKGM